VEQLQKEVNADLPTGCPRQQVEGWLRARGVPFTDVLAIMDGRKIGLSATIPQPCGSWGDQEIQMFFYFDENDKLTKSIVREVVYSL
jgi:hypothetical protein